MNIKNEASEPDRGRLNDEIVGLIKAMLARGDKQSDIAGFFRVNSGRISEINTGQRFLYVPLAADGELPSCATVQCTPYEIWKSYR